eukprot:7808938-Karenia_brevis.AAC.1
MSGGQGAGMRWGKGGSPSMASSLDWGDLAVGVGPFPMHGVVLKSLMFEAGWRWWAGAMAG